MSVAPTALWLILLVALVGGGRAGAQTPRPVLLNQIDSVVGAEMGRAKVPGVAVAVVDHGTLQMAKGYGFSNVEASVPMSVETVFRIGSITKQFTATGIMQLVEQGKIALDDDITKFLPDYPTQGHKVTIQHLLTHTSGIKSYTGLGPKFWTEASRLDLSNDQMLALFKDQPFDFNPGEKYAYNNSAFFLLGVIIEKVSGMPYPRYLEERILRPLGLRSTAYCDDKAIVPHRSAGYELAGGQVVNATPISMLTPGAAGAICSTVLDLAAWQRSFNDAQLVSAASRDRMRTSAVLTNGSKTNYGFGIGVGELEGKRLFSHAGGVNGFVTWLGYFPDADVTIVVLSNSGSGPAPRIGQLIARLELGLPLPVVANLPVDTATRAQAIGTYDLGEVKLVVRSGPKGGLEGVMGAQPPTELWYQGNGEFRPANNPDFLIRFRSSQGESSVIIETPGTTLKGKKQ
jgi:CubicO group peptidase (beta-lactamase class C family)